MSDILQVVCGSVAGTLLAAALFWVPALHVYNVAALAFLGLGRMDGVYEAMPLLPVAGLTGLIIGFALFNTLPAILLAVPDESAFFTVLPGQRALMRGRGYAAILSSSLGVMLGLLFLVLIAAPLAPWVLPAAARVLRPHLHWMVWAVICFMLLSEWPKGGTRGQGGWIKLGRAWRSLLAGLATFLLAGLLGFLLFYRSPLPVAASWQSMMPAFVGLFAVPWLLTNVIGRAVIPPQTLVVDRLSVVTWLRGGAAGAMGGAFAAFMPAVTGGVGGMLAGHATSQRDPREFLVAQGACKLVYYAGALLLFLVPGLHLTRGGGAWLLRVRYAAHGFHDYFAVLAAAGISGALGLWILPPVARLAVRMLAGRQCRGVSWCCLLLVTGLVGALTGWAGLLVMATASGIGLIPVLFHSRRMNCLGIILLPIACRMSGCGHVLAAWLRLV